MRLCSSELVFAAGILIRPQASFTVLWALGDAQTRRVIERAHERAVARALRWIEDDVAETRWASGRGREKTPALVVAAFRHFDNRDGSTLLHEHGLVLNRVQRLDDHSEPKWGALDTTRLYKHAVTAGTLYTLTMTTEVCEQHGSATVPREVTPGLRPVMEMAGVDQVLIDRSSTRRRPARTPLRAARGQAGVPAGRWMGRGPAELGLAPGDGHGRGLRVPAPAQHLPPVGAGG